MRILRRKNGIRIKISKTAEDRRKLVQIALKHELYHENGSLILILSTMNHNIESYQDPMTILYIRKKPIVLAATPYISWYGQKLLACFTKEKYRRQGYGTMAVVELLKAHTEKFGPHNYGFIPCYDFYKKAIQIATK